MTLSLISSHNSNITGYIWLLKWNWMMQIFARERVLIDSFYRTNLVGWVPLYFLSKFLIFVEAWHLFLLHWLIRNLLQSQKINGKFVAWLALKIFGRLGLGTGLIIWGLLNAKKAWWGWFFSIGLLSAACRSEFGGLVWGTVWRLIIKKRGVGYRLAGLMHLMRVKHKVFGLHTINNQIIASIWL